MSVFLYINFVFMCPSSGLWHREQHVTLVTFPYFVYTFFNKLPTKMKNISLLNLSEVTKHTNHCACTSKQDHKNAFHWKTKD